MEPLLNRRQIAEQLGVSVETVDRVRKRNHTFPSPPQSASQHEH